MEKSKVVLISENKDWANIGAMFALCLNSVGINARAFTKNMINNKPFIHSEIFGDNIKLLEDSITDDTEAIIWMHSIKMNLDVDLTNKKVCVFHGGSHYRRSFKSINVGFKEEEIFVYETSDPLDYDYKKGEHIKGNYFVICIK
jgi:hypothetical protein